MKLTLLSKSDAMDLYDFEVKNRAYFEQSVPGRGDDYFNFDHFVRVLDGLLAEQEMGICYFHLIKDETGTIAGRLNLVDIENGAGHVGYRIAEAYAGKGVASRALQSLVATAKDQYRVHRLLAKTTDENRSSQRVLEKNGFQLVDVIEEDGVTFKHYSIDI